MRRGRSPRRSATKVVDGRVQRKNNWAPTDRPAAVHPHEVTLHRRDPGPGGRHLVTVAQLREVLQMLPDWDDAAVGLESIELDQIQDCMGWAWQGVVGLCAWERELWWDDCTPEFEMEHRDVLQALDVEYERSGKWFVVRWTEAQARAFQLLHVLPHEIGHHHDRMTTATRRNAARGEPYAERYALRVMDEVLPEYLRRFGL